MRWTFFHRRESNSKDVKAQPCIPYELELKADLTLEGALEAAHEEGMPQGSARGGCVEIQNDLGIYTTRSGRKFDPVRRPDDVVFKTWQQLAEEEPFLLGGCRADVL